MITSTVFLVNRDVDENSLETFELLKITVKSKTMQYCTQKNKLKNSEERNLKNNLIKLNNKIQSGDKSSYT